MKSVRIRLSPESPRFEDARCFHSLSLPPLIIFYFSSSLSSLWFCHLILSIYSLPFSFSLFFFFITLVLYLLLLLFVFLFLQSLSLSRCLVHFSSSSTLNQLLYGLNQWSHLFFYLHIHLFICIFSNQET